LTQIVTFDPSGNLYSLISDASGIYISKFANGDLSQRTLVGQEFGSENGTLLSANIFWAVDKLVFVGIFFSTNSNIKIYTFDNANLKSFLRLSISLNGTKQYFGQSTYNSAGYIYTVICPPQQFGFELAPIYYISTATWTIVDTTNMLASFTAIQQTAGDAIGGAAITAYSQDGVFLTYLSGPGVFWREKLSASTALGISTPCAVATVNDMQVMSYPVGNYVLVFFYNGAVFQSRLFSYTRMSSKLVASNTNISIKLPFDVTYRVQSISLSYKISYDTNTPRFFYTMYLYNPAIINFEYYIQNGEIDATGNIIWFSNIQIGESYNVSPSNTIQSSSTLTAVCAGQEMITYSTTYQLEFTAIVEKQRTRDFCQTFIIVPGCDCPKVPVNSIVPPVDGLTHTLSIATCNPIIFTNPVASEGCAPIYTPPTSFLSSKPINIPIKGPGFTLQGQQGAEPPQGPAVSKLTRAYQTISGIDQICKPIPGRYGSSRTARIRSNIESASTTQYVDTVLPVVPYPFPCPVYGNQSGNPVASLCRPSIDARPTTNIAV